MPVSISSKTRVRGTPEPFFFPPDPAGFDAGLQRQHDARQFAAGGDLLQPAQRLAGVGRDHVRDLIEARGGPVPFLVGCR